MRVQTVRQLSEASATLTFSNGFGVFDPILQRAAVASDFGQSLPVRSVHNILSQYIPLLRYKMGVSDMAKLFPIIAFAATPIFIFLIWSFCGGSVDFMDLADEGIGAEASLTDEERAEARMCMEANLITTHFEKPASNETTASNAEVSNEEGDVESGLTSSVAPTCSICLAEYQHDDSISRSINPDCEHLFHKDCILDWLVASIEQQSSPECPICRREFLNQASDDKSGECPADKAGSNSNNSDTSSCARPPRRTSFNRRSFSSTGGSVSSSPV